MRTLFIDEVDRVNEAQRIEKLEAQVDHLNALIETAPAIICRLDLHGKIIYVNRKFEEITSYSRDEVLGKQWFKLNIISPSHIKPLLKRTAEKIMGKEPSPMEIKFKRKDGKWRWVSGIGELIKVNGKSIGVHVIATDITDRKEKEAIIRRSEKRLRVMVESSPLPLIMTRPKTGKIIMTNNAFNDLFQYTRNQISDHRSPSLWAYVEQDRSSFISTLFEKGHVNQREVKARKLDGTIFDILLSAQLVDYEGDLAALAVIYDLSERKKLEEKLMSAVSEWRITFDSITHPVSIHSEDFTVLRANKAFSDAVNMTPKNVIGKKCYQLIHGTNEPPPICPMLHTMETKQPSTTEFFEPHLGLHLQVTTSPVLENNGEMKRCVHVINDISQRAKSEEERKQNTEKLIEVIENAIEAISTTVEIKDPYTAGHQVRVAKLASAIARELDLSEDQIMAIRLAGTVHDIGKIYIPSEILSKPGEISELEYGMIKTHPYAGYNVLRRVNFPWSIAEIVLQHHERMDGSGYPEGLNGDNILLEARILAVADVVEAMSSHRPYRPALGLDEALNEISENAGTKYDADVVKACLKLFQEKNYKFEEIIQVAQH